MQISIWDLDWYYNHNAMPNIQCMQLSSYCKQKGHQVNFITKEEHITLSCDKMYIFKEEEKTPMPLRSLLDKTYVKLIGKGFKYFSTIKLSSVIVACRPDYLLYEGTEGKYHNSNFIQFFHERKLVRNRQDFHNTLQRKKFTIVTDNQFWQASKEDILWCLEFLQKERNIMFKYPISLAKIIADEDIKNAFMQLKFSTGTEFKWRNDLSSTNVEPIIDFLKELKLHTKSSLGFIPIKAQIDNDLNLDLYRCFNIVYKFKVAKLQCRIISPDQPIHQVFTSLTKWTTYDFQLSYVEYILHNQVATSGVLWYNILNNSIHWRNAKIDILLWLLSDRKWSESQHLIFSQWGDDLLSNQNVDYNYIRERINLIYKDEEDE